MGGIRSTQEGGGWKESIRTPHFWDGELQATLLFPLQVVAEDSPFPLHEAPVVADLNYPRVFTSFLYLLYQTIVRNGLRIR